MKPGWKTSEFWVALTSKLLAVACVIWGVSSADEQHLVETSTRTVTSIFAMIAAAKVLVSYIQSRAQVKAVIRGQE
jgi:hypothetical protein